MTSPRIHSTILGATAALVLGAIPGAAAAHDYCIGNPAACPAGGDASFQQLAMAVNDAANSDADDRIFLGTGTITGAFSYAGKGALEIVGSGNGKTFLVGPSNPDPGNVKPALKLAGAATVRDLDVVLPAVDGAKGLELGAGAEATDVRVVSKVLAAPANGIGLTLTGGTFRRGIIGPGGTGASVGVVASKGDNLVDGTRVIADTAVFSAAAGTLHVSRSKLRGGTKVVENVFGKVILDSDLVDARIAQVALLAKADPDVQAMISGRHLTIVGADVKGTVGIGAMGASKGVSKISLRDSIIAGLPVPVYRTASSGGGADVVLDHVAHPYVASIYDVNDGGTGSTTETAPVVGAAAFVNAGADDFRLVAGSALLDAGSDTPAADGEPATDLAGEPRVADADGDCVARRDLGAYEQPGVTVLCPEVSVPGGGSGADGGVTDGTGTTSGTGSSGGVISDPGTPAADRVAPVMTKLRSAWKKGKATVRFTLSEQGKVKVSVQRLKGKRWVTVKTITISSAKAGANSKAFKVTRRDGARYRVSAVATDAVGNRAKAIRARIAIKR